MRDECDYRLEQINHSSNRQETIIRERLRTEKDERIIRMKESELEKLKVANAHQRKMVEGTIDKADIHTNLLVRGVLHVD